MRFENDSDVGGTQKPKIPGASVPRQAPFLGCHGAGCRPLATIPFDSRMYVRMLDGDLTGSGADSLHPYEKGVREEEEKT